MWEVGDSFGGVQAAVSEAERRRDAGIMQGFQMLRQGLADRNAIQAGNRDFAQRRRLEDQNTRQLGLENALRRQQFDHTVQQSNNRNNLDREYLELQKRQMATTGNGNAMPPEYGEAFDAVNRGLITDPNQIDSLFPSLPDQNRMRLKDYLYAANDQHNQQVDAAQSLADRLNTELGSRKKKKTDAKQAELKKGQWFDGNLAGKSDTEIKAEIDAMGYDDADISAVHSLAQKSKLGGSLTFDPVAKKFVPSIGRRSTKPSTQSQAVEETRKPDMSDAFIPSPAIPGFTPPAADSAPVSDVFSVGGWAPPNQSPSGYAPRMPDQIYAQVNALIAQGVPPDVAAAQVKAAMQSAMAPR